MAVITSYIFKYIGPSHNELDTRYTQQYIKHNILAVPPKSALESIQYRGRLSYSTIILIHSCIESYRPLNHDIHEWLYHFAKISPKTCGQYSTFVLNFKNME